MILLNGEPSSTIDVADRGFQYGDGLFETLEVLNGKPLFLDRHLQRLADGCRRLLIPPPDLMQLTAEAIQLSAGEQRAVLKMIITRGSGGRGYRQPPQISPTRLLSLHSYPVYPLDYALHGIRVRLCQSRLASHSPLAGIKHLNRLEQILARAEWQDETIQEGLMLDSQDQLIEGTMSNLFLVKDGTLYTPELTGCGVAGIVRAIVMELAQQQHIALFVQALDKTAAWQADEIFISNSVIGIWPVVQLEQVHFNIGPQTRRLQALFNAMRSRAA